MDATRLSWMSEGGLADAFEDAQASRDVVGDQIGAGVRAGLLGGEPATVTVGRFVLLERLGAGAMGVVYAAYDPKLDRRVALKMLREGLDGAEERIAREARALAKLNDPHVVTVHEVGERDGKPWVAMECVEGRSLRDVLEQDRPDVSRTLSLFVEAGRGLAAAHAAGIVHRDFKPANVVVGDDGRVRVADFGLATGAQDVESKARPAGTPMYMAPEQRLGRGLTPAADQYAFCVALFEALTGERPAAAKGLTWGEAGRDLHSTVREAIERGLAPEPGDRWPAMSDLIEALTPDPTQRTRRHLRWVAGVALGLGVVAWIGWARPQERPCTGAASELAAVWSDARSDRLERAFARSELPYAPRVWTRLQPRIERYAKAWAQQHTDACEATTVRREQSPAALDLRMNCLRRSKDALDAALARLEQGDSALVRRSDALIDGLPTLARCEDAEALGREVPLPPEAMRADVEAVERELAAARATRLAGDPRAALARIEPLVERASATRHGPVQGDVAMQHARALRAVGKTDAAADALSTALQLGLQWGRRRASIDAATELVVVVGVHQHRPGRARAYADVAQGLIAADDDAGLRAQLLHNRALVYADDQQIPEALELAEQALELARTLPPEPRTVAAMRSNLANLLEKQGDFDGAVRQHRAAVAVLEEALGPQHPHLADVRMNLATGLFVSGDYEDAAEQLRAALEVMKTAKGPEHPDVGRTHSNLAGALVMSGRDAEAVEQLEAALRVYAVALDADDPALASARNNLALALLNLGRLREAEDQARQALALLERLRGADDPELVRPLHNLARIQLGSGRVAEGRASLRRGLAIAEHGGGPQSPMAAMMQHALGSELVAEAQTRAEGVALLRQAWAVHAKPDQPADTRGETGFALAQALEGEEARAIARQALAAYREAGPLFEQQRAQVERWLLDTANERIEGGD